MLKHTVNRTMLLVKRAFVVTMVVGITTSSSIVATQDEDLVTNPFLQNLFDLSNQEPSTDTDDIDISTMAPTNIEFIDSDITTSSTILSYDDDDANDHGSADDGDDDGHYGSSKTDVTRDDKEHETPAILSAWSSTNGYARLDLPSDIVDGFDDVGTDDATKTPLNTDSAVFRTSNHDDHHYSGYTNNFIHDLILIGQQEKRHDTTIARINSANGKYGKGKSGGKDGSSGGKGKSGKSGSSGKSGKSNRSGSSSISSSTVVSSTDVDSSSSGSKKSGISSSDDIASPSASASIPSTPVQTPTTVLPPSFVSTPSFIPTPVATPAATPVVSPVTAPVVAPIVAPVTTAPVVTPAPITTVADGIDPISTDACQVTLVPSASRVACTPTANGGACISTFATLVTVVNSLTGNEVVGLCDTTGPILTTAAIDIQANGITLCCAGIAGCELEAVNDNVNLIVSGADSIIQDIRFTNGVDMVNDGGNVRILGDGTHLIERATFVNGVTAGSGGNLFLDYDGTLVMRDSRFAFGTANLFGGAIAMDGPLTRVQIFGTEFICNTAVGTGAQDGGGGATFFTRQNAGTDSLLLEIQTSIFNANTASTLGGAILVVETGDNPEVELFGNGFSNNSAQLGGAVIIDGVQDNTELQANFGTGNSATAMLCDDFAISVTGSQNLECLDITTERSAYRSIFSMVP